MAMMTGRVLLVCALCVLWCLTVFGDARDNRCSEGDGNVLIRTTNGGNDGVSIKADCALLSARVGLIKAVEAAEGEEMHVDTDQSDHKLKEKLQDNTLEDGGVPGPGGDVAVQAAAAAASLKPEESDKGEMREKPKVVGSNDEDHPNASNIGIISDPQKPTTDHSSSSASGSAVVKGSKDHNVKRSSNSHEISEEMPPQEDAAVQEDAKEEAGQKKNAGEKKETQLSEREEPQENKDKKNDKASTETHQSQKKQKEIQPVIPPPPLPTSNAKEARITIENPAAPTTMHGQSSPKGNVPMQQPNEVQSGMHTSNNPHTESGATITANQHNESSADHAGTGPLPPTAIGDAGNNEADKSTEDEIPNNDPAADGTGMAEENPNENKDANPKETPVTATAMKTTTATPGDSDGSTAVSHTTSPLLLLLVVACAAAAAVVAA
ncbi:mucin-associated surface protein (MASP) [Trypanosoma cruzi Dm28c]|uniref:Mucin-associated surface protein (MASP) n=2 Tax=Trypanosoma cruzi TaxID=5693 RepID=V5AI08_TRYCR|nr:mucin-associated surface protein (MASP) [Trypanosoma cruzi Dm28c]PBJ76361.1 mucin-associated surface protein [Trypanosoma cruzi cruzi]PBJ77219.1 mucin-associated surface protein [Trypanosoma cruzi cruzi]PWU86921.1 Mucin-associated surface protein (MASP) [Trypanosoma cruzi]PWU87136.1 Mucin-associated surface protein (MASP) [Trypanosoma cruzi]